MHESNAVKLKRIIAMEMESDPALTGSDITRTIKARESALVMDWAFDQLAVFVSRQICGKRKLSRPPGPYQMFLGGFNNLAERLPLPRKGRVSLAEATIVDLRNSLKMTRFKRREDDRRTEKLIKEMWPYAKTRRGLTVEGYLKLRAAGIKPPRTRSPGTTLDSNL